MNFFQAILLGIVQGITEFLPVSSSGHLMIVRKLLGIDGSALLFDLLLHVGTLCAVIVQMRKELIVLFKKPKKMLILVIATIPAAGAGFFLADYIEGVFGGGKFLWLTFLLTAFVLFSSELLAKHKKSALAEVGVRHASVMGLMQAAALLPGLSRSGCTIFGGCAAGAERESVAKFSFLMSIPIILGGAAVSLTGVIGAPVTVGWWETLCALTAAFVSGMFAIGFMMRIISKASYKPFAVYLVAVSVLSFFLF